MSMGHEAYADLWTRNQAHAPDPHVGPYLELCTSFMRAGRASALEHHLSTEEERRTLPYFQETARPGRREWLAVAFFTVEGHDWCFPLFGEAMAALLRRRKPLHLASVGPHVAKSGRSGRKVCCVRRHVETLGAGASELRRSRHRCNRPRNADESACAKSAWRGLQPRPGSSGGPRSRQQSQIAAAGFICLAHGARRRSVLCADRRRSRRSAVASG